MHFSLFLIPWFSVVVFCLVTSWYFFYFLNLDVLLAPIVKFWLFFKPLIFKYTSVILLWIWVNLFSKTIGWIAELATLFGAVLGGWKTWSAKKLARLSGRYIMSLSARFVAVSVLLNLLFGHERRGIRLLPQFLMHKLHTSWFSRALRWWTNSSERHKRLLFGVALCLIFVAAGQAFLGISVLLFDLVWELALIVWRWILLLWRILAPLALKLLPNFVGNFITRNLIPAFVKFVPTIKEDYRVLYIRYNFRRHYRRFKAWLYIMSRSRRSTIRNHVSPLMSNTLKQKKTELLDAANRLRENKNDKQ